MTMITRMKNIKTIQVGTSNSEKLIIILFAFITILFNNSYAQVSIIPPALTLTACPAFPTSPQTLGNIVITETSVNDISGSGTLVISTSPSFQFTSGGSVSVTGNDVTGISVSQTSNTTITLTFTVSDTIQLDTITMSGIQVRGLFSPTPLSNIFRSGGTAVIAGDTLGTVHATLTSTDAPALNSSFTAPAICSESVFSYAPSSTVSGTTFNWTRAAVSGISNASGSGTNNPSEILIDTLSTAVNVEYIYTLEANGCTNPTTFSVAVTVNPLPVLTSTLTPPAICSGTSFSYTASATIPGTTYSWSRAAVSGISNIAATGSNDPAETLTDTTSMPVNAVYLYSLTADGCTNDSLFSVAVTVNPAPTITSAIAFTSCNGDSLNFELTSDVSSSYTWLAADNANTTGESLTSQTTDTIYNSITNSTDTVQQVIYTITPVSSLTCQGTPQTFTVNVNPTPEVQNNDSIAVCSGVNLNLPLISNVPSLYTWVAVNNLNTTGESTSIQTTDTITDVITNNTALAQVVVYTVTPVSSSGNCSGTPKTITVIVNPEPTMTSASEDTICSGTTLNVPFTSTLASTFSWIANDNLNTTGESTSSHTQDTLADAIVNLTSSAETVAYSVTPVSITGSCTGTPQTLTILVNPLPVSNAGSDMSICSGTIDSIGGTVTIGYEYTWNTATGLSDSTISAPQVTLTNNTTNPVSEEFRVITTMTSTGCQSSDSVTVTINPQPVLSINQPTEVCAPAIIDLTDSLITAGSTGGGTFSYWSDITATDTLMAPESISTSDTNFIKLTAIGGCYDIDSVFTAVKPAAIANAGNDVAMCSGTVDSIGTLSLPGYSYSWNTNIGISDSTLSKTQVLATNNTNTPLVLNYIVLATIVATGCQSTDTIIVTINPQPVLVINHPAPACAPNTVDLTAASITAGSTGGGTFTYWKNSTATDTLQNPAAITVTDTNYIKVTAAGGCTDFDSVITFVHPAVPSYAGEDISICSGVMDTIGSTAINGNTYLWNTGAGLNDSTISEPVVMATNNTATPIIINYIRTTTTLATGCQAVDTVTVTINPQPVLLITPPPSSCSSDTINLTDSIITAGSSAGTFSYWTDANATDSLLNPDAITTSDTSYIKLTATGGCIDIESVITIINPLPSVSFTGLNFSNCYNSSPQTLTGSPAGGVFSGNGVSGNTFTASIAGVGVQPVTYTYTDTNGCSRSASQFIQILAVSNVLPQICMVTVDTGSHHNIVYWNKAAYTNVDSFIVYREITTGNYQKVGAVNRTLGFFTDTTQQLYFPNTGDPNTASYRYKLQIRDSCGDHSALSAFHKTIYLSHNAGTFNFTHYEIENESVPLSGLTSYVLMRDGDNTGNWDVVGSSFGSTLTITDASYSSYPNGRWRIETLWDISCGTPPVTTTLSNIITDTTSDIGVADLENFSVPVAIYPNPYTQNTTIQYILNNNSEVKIEVYNALGEKIETLVNTSQNAGEYKCRFGAKSLGFSAGIYFVKVSVNGKYKIQRIVEVE